MLHSLKTMNTLREKQQEAVHLTELIRYYTWLETKGVDYSEVVRRARMLLPRWPQEPDDRAQLPDDRAQLPDDRAQKR